MAMPNRLLYLACCYIDNFLQFRDVDAIDIDALDTFMRKAGGRLGYQRATWRTELAALAPAQEEGGSDDELAALSSSDRDPEQVVALARRFLAKTLKRHRTNRPAPVERSAHRFADALALDERERATLVCLAVRAFEPALDAFFNSIADCSAAMAKHVAVICGMGDQPFERVLACNGTLASQGIVLSVFWDAQLTPGFTRTLETATQAGIPVAQAIVGKTVKSSLKAQDIAWMRDEVDNMTTILGAALSRREAGVNILLHGKPGVGKTELAKWLGMKCGGKVYLVGENDNTESSAVSSAERLKQLQLANRLLARVEQSVLLFDEAEDMFSGLFSASDAPSKVQLNRMLENNAVPTIWTSNSIEGVDPAHLRRFSAILQMEPAPVDVRREQIARRARQKGVNLSAQTLDRLAAEAAVSPGIIDSAARVSVLVGGDETQFTRTVNQLVSASAGKPIDIPELRTDAEAFDAALCNTDVDIGLLTSRLLAAPTKRFSLLLFGAPGTGKTLYTRELATQLGMPLLIKRASDILNAYVGETEKAIAQAFREAIDRKAFLVIDEADSLLQRRTRAERNWEVTQVNEMLTWMERHPLPFAFTTNLVESLDPAALRRFTFKLGFRCLKPEQAALAFERYLELPAPAGLRKLNLLTPADFALVKHRAGLLGVNDPDALVDMLGDEMALKEGQARSIGFLASMN